MHKIPTMQEQSQQKQQLELQRQSFIVNTRLRLAETFLNTMIGRPDIDLENGNNQPFLTELSIEYANVLMTKLGLVLPTKNVE